MKKKTGLIVILSLVIVLALCGIIAILILDPGRDAVLSKEASRKAAKAADTSLRFGYSSENESSVPASDSLVSLSLPPVFLTGLKSPVHPDRHLHLI